jgi:hypothetical protein
MSDSGEHLAPPPQQGIVLDVVFQLFRARTLGAFAQLGVADFLHESPLALPDLAIKLSVNPDRLYRLLRGVINAGFVEVDASERFELTALGRTLLSDGPGSMRFFLMAVMAPGHWLPWGKLDEAVTTGEPATVRAFGKDVWSYYSENDAEGQLFADAMFSSSSIAIAPVIASYSFEGAKTIVDVGGSHGNLLAAALKSTSGARGILFDLPSITSTAEQYLRKEGVADIVDIVSGDFFKSVPAGDAYLMKHILHDWADDECIQILKNVRKSMLHGARVSVIEIIMEAAVSTPSPNPAIFMDINMMTMCTGRERTVDEYKSLFAQADLVLCKEVKTPSPYSVLEAVAA